MELDRVPLWRGNHVAVRQLAEDFARYVYLRRLRDPQVLTAAVQDGLALLLWDQETFAYADGFDDATGRYRGLRCGQRVDVFHDTVDGLVVRPEVAAKQQEADAANARPAAGGAISIGTGRNDSAGPSVSPTGFGTPTATASKPQRYYGTAALDPSRVGRDAGTNCR